jgi:uncharacterized protein (TIGR02996 family)
MDAPERTPSACANAGVRPAIAGRQRAFLRAVLEDPEDDTPRLVYTDWLDVQGDADRAEFIRTQCHLAEDDPQRWPLGSRTWQLLDRHREEWTRPLRAAVPGLLPEDVAFARGFPSGVTLRRVEDLAHAVALSAVAPLPSRKYGST